MTSGEAPPITLHRDRRRVVVVAILIAVTDLATKVVGSALLRHRSVHVVGSLWLRLVHNTGMAFSVGSGAPQWLLLGGTAAVIGWLTFVAWRGGFAGPVPTGLVLGGALANLIDRLVGGSVVDLFDLGWWPTFNLADMGITIGVALTIIEGIRGERPQ